VGIILISGYLPYLSPVVFIYPPGAFPETDLTVGRCTLVSLFFRKAFAGQPVKQRRFTVTAQSQRSGQGTPCAQRRDPDEIPPVHGLPGFILIDVVFILSDISI
jgi:hypothetical protein